MENDNAPMTIDQALASMRAERETQERPPERQPSGHETDDDTPVEQSSDFSDDSADDFDDNDDNPPSDTPANEPVSDEGDGDAGDPAELPPIDPPSSWPKSEWDAFKALPRATQERIATLEQNRMAEHRQRQNEFAAREKAIAEQAAAFEQERQALVAQLFEQLPPEPDEALIDEDPVEYLRQKAQYDRAVEKVGSEYRKVQEAAERRRQEAARQEDEWRKAEAAKLSELIPDLKVPQKASRIVSEITQYAESAGYAPEMLASASAQDIHTLYKAMQWDRAQQAAKAAKVKPVPKVAAPGNSRTSAEQAADKRKSLLARLEKTGSIEDALALMRYERG